MKRGDDEQDVGEAVGELEVVRHFGDTEEEVDAPLTSNVIRSNEGEDGDPDDAGEEDVVHVGIPGHPVVRQDGLDEDTRKHVPFTFLQIAETVRPYALVSPTANSSNSSISQVPGSLVIGIGNGMEGDTVTDLLNILGTTWRW